MTALVVRGDAAHLPLPDNRHRMSTHSDGWFPVWFCTCGAVGSGASDFREQWLRHTKEPRP